MASADFVKVFIVFSLHRVAEVRQKLSDAVRRYAAKAAAGGPR
jgi:hypothetical protein